MELLRYSIRDIARKRKIRVQDLAGQGLRLNSNHNISGQIGRVYEVTPEFVTVYYERVGEPRVPKETEQMAQFLLDEKVFE